MSATWRFVLLVWAGSRALFLAAGALGAELVHPLSPGRPLPTGALSYWAHWDGAWYTAIAAHGYRGTEWPLSTNFFPLYPIAVRTLALLPGGYALWAVVISLCASLLAFYFFHELARAEWNRSVARWSLLALAFFPGALFLNAAYSEGLFLALAVGACWAVRVREDMALAAVLSFFAAMTRPSGIFLVFPIAHESIRLRRAQRLGPPAVALSASPMLGLGAYMLYLSREAGDPLLFSRVSRSHWARHLANPISTLERAWDTARAGAGWAVRPDRVLDAASVGPSTKAMDAMNVPVVALAVALLIAGARRLPLGLLMYSAAVIGLPILVGPRYSPFTGMPRYLLSAFPLFFVAGMALARSRWVAVVWLGLGSALGVVWTLWFVSGRWA